MIRKTRKTRKTRSHKKHARKQKGGTRTANQSNTSLSGCFAGICSPPRKTNREAALDAREAERKEKATREAEREAANAEVQAASAEVEASKRRPYNHSQQMEAMDRLFVAKSRREMIMNEL